MSHRPNRAAIAIPRAARLGAAALWMLLLAAATLQSARAETVNAIRVRLNPERVAAGPLSSEQLARLEMLAGTSLVQVGATRTGALDFALGEPVDAAALKPRLRALREDRSVLWAEPAPPAGALLKRATTRPGSASGHASGHAYVDTGYKLMVRLAGDPEPDWAALLPRFARISACRSSPTGASATYGC